MIHGSVTMIPDFIVVEKTPFFNTCMICSILSVQ
jgi:hypothetical protein